MRPLRIAVLAAGLTFALPLAPFSGNDASASVSIAVAFEALVAESSSVAVVTPVEQKSVWENGRIYTYTRVHSDQGVAGELATHGEAWIRTMGGVVGHIGQSVDGEPVLTVGRPSLLFLRSGPPGALEVTARAQGQFPVTLDDTKTQRLMRSSAVGVLLPPKAASSNAVDSTIRPKATGPATPAPVPTLAHEVLHQKRLDDGIREIAAAWKRLHAPSVTK